MSNISFTNLNLFYVIIPLFVIFVGGFFLSIRKKGFNFHTITTLIIHVVIAILLTFTAVGTNVSRYIAESQMVILTDVSDSNKNKYDVIDSYVNQIINKNKSKADIAVVSFAKDYELLVDFNKSFTSVKKSEVDKTSTDIASALEYSSSLFNGSKTKRIVLITDAKVTDNDVSEVVNRVKEDGVFIEAIYLENTSSTLEVQINDVDFNKQAYINSKEKVRVTIQSNYETELNVELRLNNALLEVKKFKTSGGLDYIELDLDNKKLGLNEYEVNIYPSIDTYKENNSFKFTQETVDYVNVFILTGNKDEEDAVRKIYGTYNNIHYFDDEDDFPCSLDALLFYDEFVISNADLSILKDANSFITNLQSAVVNYGKTLNVLGMEQSYINRPPYDSFLNMLPVNFDTQSSRMALVVVLDASLSMSNNKKLDMAKLGAIQCLELLDNDDYFSLIKFDGNTNVVVPLSKVYDRENIVAKINTIQAGRGTNMTAALSAAYDQLLDLNFDSKKVIIISDGMPTDKGEEKVVSDLYDIGVNTSVINIQSEEGINFLSNLATLGDGNYFFVGNVDDIPSIMINEVDTNISSSYIEENVSINISKKNDSLMYGVTSLPNINGFSYALGKYSANNLLTTKFTHPDTGVLKDAPVFSYWNYGKGKVSIFLSTLSKDWASSYLNDPNGMKFLKNLINYNLPESKINNPFTIESTQNGYSQTIKFSYEGMGRTYSFSNIKIISPSGKELTSSISFIDGKYVSTFETPEIGNYTYYFTYSYGDNSFDVKTSVSHSYSSEYNYFDTTDEYLLYSIVSEGNMPYKNINELLDKEFEYLYKTSDMTLVLLILVSILFIVDIGVRKLKIADIKDFFNNSSSSN